MWRNLLTLRTGPGESGKSTIFKQLKLLQKNGGFTTKELESYRSERALYCVCVVWSHTMPRQSVCGNLLTQMKIVISASKELEIPLQCAENQVYTHIPIARPLSLQPFPPTLPHPPSPSLHASMCDSLHPQVCADNIMRLPVVSGGFNQDTSNDLKRLWNDNGIQQVWYTMPLWSDIDFPHRHTHCAIEVFN